MYNQVKNVVIQFSRNAAVIESTFTNKYINTNSYIYCESIYLDYLMYFKNPYNSVQYFDVYCHILTLLYGRFNC